MKYIFFLLFTPLLTNAQSKNKSLSTFLDKDWMIMKAINKSDNNLVYDRKKNIKKWNLDKTSIYRLTGTEIGIMHGESLVDIGIADSIQKNRFIIHVTYSNGYKSLFEYSNIRFSNNSLTYTFTVWNYHAETKKRLLHYSYDAICERSKHPLSKPTFAEIEKMKGNKISFVFTTDDGKPVANKEIKIIIALKGYKIEQSVFTDSAGNAKDYYPDSYFASNKHITMFMEYGNLKSSAILEQKYCPAVLKRALTIEKDEGIRISRQDD